MTGTGLSIWPVRTRYSLPMIRDRMAGGLPGLRPVTSVPGELSAIGSQQGVRSNTLTADRYLDRKGVFAMKT